MMGESNAKQAYVRPIVYINDVNTIVKMGQMGLLTDRERTFHVFESLINEHVLENVPTIYYGPCTICTPCRFSMKSLITSTLVIGSIIIYMWLKCNQLMINIFEFYLFVLFSR